MIATLTDIDYPSTDGLPIAESTQQFDWITFIKGNLEILFRKDPMVFVAGDLFWYPVRGDNKTRTAPDTMVVLGRPKGPRPSYMQFEEEGIPPQVVFEVLSPGNTAREMAKKLDFYDRFGVEEYYIYDFTGVTLQGWLRRGDDLHSIPKIQNGWTSPRLKVAMRVGEQLEMFAPDGKAFKDLYEIGDILDEVEGLRVDRAEAVEREKLLRAEKLAAVEREKLFRAEKLAAVERERLLLERQDAMQADKRMLEDRLREFERLLREKGIDPQVG